MKSISIVLSVVCSAWLIGNQAHGESITLQDIVNSTAPLPTAAIHAAREAVTLDPDKSSAGAVAVVGDRILATGTLEELKAAAGDQPYAVDESFADQPDPRHVPGHHDQRNGEDARPGRGHDEHAAQADQAGCRGAIYSQLMQPREPYLDRHHGEWIMPPEDFANAFRIYRDASRAAPGLAPSESTFKAMGLDGLAHAGERQAHGDACMRNRVFAAAMTEGR